MEAEEPVDLQDRGLKVNESLDHGLHVNQVGSEEDPEQDPADRDRQEEKEGKIISQDGNVKSFLGDQPPGEQNRQGDGNEIPGIKPSVWIPSTHPGSG